MLGQPNAMQFVAWLDHAHRGDRFVYYVGFLALDSWPPTLAVQQAAWAASDAKRVWLFQRKLKPNVYEYIAVKTSRR